MKLAWRSFSLTVAMVLTTFLTLDSLLLDRIWSSLEIESAAQLSSLTSIKSAVLPSPFNQTGVILFHHLFKTGGTTIRENFMKLRDIHYVRASNMTDVPPVFREMEAILSGNLTKILFVELHVHVGTLPGVVELHPFMQRWRALERENNVPFFAFTVLREPINHHLSSFQAFHSKRCTEDWCSQFYFSQREENIAATAAPNRQCAALARGQQHVDAWHNQTNVTAQECQQMKHLLQTDLDWVGTTETLSNTTLPMLFKMLKHENLASKAKSFNVAKTKPYAIFQASNLTKATTQALKDSSVLDSMLYESFRNG